MNAWAPTQALIDAECSPSVTIANDVCVEWLLRGLFEVARHHFDERAAVGGDGVYRAWQIAIARYNAYQELAAGEVVWH